MFAAWHEVCSKGDLRGEEIELQNWASRAGWLHAATLTAGVALASTAQAQDAGTIQGTQSGTVTMSNPTRTATLRTTTPNTRQHWISHQDCVDNITLTFRVNVPGADPTKVLFAYVGTQQPLFSTTELKGCLNSQARGDASLCKPLTVESKSTSLPIVVISAQDLTKLFGITNCGDDGSGNAENLNLQFYFLHDPGTKTLADGDNFVVYEGTGIDLWGPGAPHQRHRDAGDEELSIEFESASSSDLASFNSTPTTAPASPTAAPTRHRRRPVGVTPRSRRAAPTPLQRRPRAWAAAPRRAQGRAPRPASGRLHEQLRDGHRRNGGMGEWPRAARRAPAGAAVKAAPAAAAVSAQE